MINWKSASQNSVDADFHSGFKQIGFNMTYHEIESVTLESGKFYKTPSGNFPSVTTVLSKMSDKSGLDKWIERVGKDEANRIKKAAAERGTEMHRMIEARFFGEEVSTENDVARHLYRSLELHLAALKIEAVEIPLYSENLRIAGRADCIGLYNNELSIVDFKTSLQEKRKEWIKDYFFQATIYSLMAYELYGIECKQVVIMIAVESGFPQVFIERVSTHAKEAISIIKRYHSLYGT